MCVNRKKASIELCTQPITEQSIHVYVL